MQKDAERRTVHFYDLKSHFGSQFSLEIGDSRKAFAIMPPQKEIPKGTRAILQNSEQLHCKIFVVKMLMCRM
jgi:hypothetical protein